MRIKLALIGVIWCASLAAQNVSAADGKKVYDDSCKTCHGIGLAGAPKVGDVAVWKERAAKGTDVLVKNAINGVKSPKGMMPARGGNPDITDEEIKAAVAYMVSSSK